MKKHCPLIFHFLYHVSHPNQTEKTNIRIAEHYLKTTKNLIGEVCIFFRNKNKGDRHSPENMHEIY